MIQEFIEALGDWGDLDTWITITGALAAMACSLPGCFLLLRRQSMMGDALSHTSLLGITLGYLFAMRLYRWGWISAESMSATQHLLIVGGAIAVGILAATLSEWIQKQGKVEAGAALGVVFTVMFSAGLLLIRLAADDAHIDADCVLYGSVETAYVGGGVPESAVVNGLVLLGNLLLITVFYKELRVSAFDPAFATAIGIPARSIHYILMSVTAATVVAAFESVGAILVIAMLIVPAATAHLLTDRLWLMIIVSLFTAALCAILGHAAAITLPQMIFSRLGFSTVQTASTAGMMAVAGGCLFLTAALFGPRHGIVAKAWSQAQLSLRIATEDVLGMLYRLQETSVSIATTGSPVPSAWSTLELRGWARWIAIRALAWRREVRVDHNGLQLTERGRERAGKLVRSHRLWESYMAKHFPLEGDHLHQTAARVEHFITPEIREALSRELAGPDQDPHGREIPREK